MLYKELKSAVIEKSKFLGLPIEKVSISPINIELVGPQVIFEDFEDKELFLRVNNIDFPKEEIELNLEKVLCYFMLLNKGVCERKYFSLGPYPSIDYSMIEMYNAYVCYFGSKVHIEKFGMDRFKKYQNAYLKENIKIIDNKIRENDDVWMRRAFIFYEYKEQVKCDLIKNNEQVLPKVIKEITKPFKDCFEEINNSNLEWIEKSKLLYLMMKSNIGYLDVNESYLTNKLILNESPRLSPISRDFLIKGIFNDKNYDFALRIENLMKEQYKKIVKNKK